MKRSILNVAIAVALAFQALSASAALNVWTTLGATTLEGGATTYDFGNSTATDSGPVINPLLATTDGVATFVGGEVFNTISSGISGVSARPVGSTDNFWSVQAGQTGSVTFSAPVTYYGFLWGSPDPTPWNTVTFFNGSTVLGQFDQTATGLNNNWSSTTFFNVSTGTGLAITSITFTANQNAFETDNHAYIAAIPEPDSYAMLLAGLGLLGFMARRRKQKAA